MNQNLNAIVKICDVYQTYNYGMFKKLEFNRAVYELRFKRLVASFSRKDVLNPIIVNEKYEICDGQGRYEARKFLHKPIIFIVVPGLTIEDCQIMNKYNMPWRTTDFIDSYADGGNRNYQNLRDALSATKLSLVTALRLSGKTLCSRAGGKTSGENNILENGTLKYGDDEYNLCLDRFNKATDIRIALKTSEKPNHAFYVAVSIMADNPAYDHQKMLKKCREQSQGYTSMSTLKDELAQLTDIYNYKVYQANKIYFTDALRNRGKNVREYSTNQSPFSRGDDISTLRASKR